MRGVSRELDGVDRASKGATFQTGRLGNQLTNLAGQIAHVHPVVGNLANALGNFAVGSAFTFGIVAGVTAIAVVYDKLTESTRKAREEQKKLSDALVTQFAPKTGPNSQTAKQFNAALQERADLTKKLAQLEDDKAHPLAQGFLGQKLYDSRIKEVEKRLVELKRAIGTAMTSSISSIETVVVSGAKATETMTAKVKDLSQTLEQMRASMEDFWGPMRRFNEQFALPDLVGDLTPGAVDISDSVKIADKVGKDILTASEKAERDAQMIQGAILNSASFVAGSIVSALNVGGGGKGSQIGGQLGGAALGLGLGLATGGAGLLTSGLWGIAGSVIGSIAGSFLGGLFDHKKAIDINTAAVKQNTAALLLNSPSGYKTASGRFDATEVKEFRRGLQRYATRGGAPILVAP